jgi:Tfp pilus assembly protein PilO
MHKLNLKKIDLWSVHLKSIVIIATIFFICILGYFCYIQTAIKKKEKIYLSFQFFKKELNNQLEIVSNYSHYQKKIEKIKNTFDIYSDNANKSILRVLTGQLSTPVFGINKIRISATKKNFLNSLQVESDFSSTHDNIVDFIYQITSLNKLVLIEEFNWCLFDNLLKNHKQTINFLFKIYSPYFNSKNLILALSQINKLKVKPAKNSNLIKYPLNKIKMLGFVSTGKYQDLGFIVLPNKQICKLKLGDHIGMERGVVIGIYASKIIIQNNRLNKIIKLSIDRRIFSYVKPNT